MSGDAAAGTALTCLGAGMVRYLSAAQLDDLRSIRPPDAVVLTGDPDDRDDHDHTVAAAREAFDAPVLYPGAPSGDSCGTPVVAGGRELVAPGEGGLAPAAAGETRPGGGRPVVFTAAVAVEADRNALEARLRGREALAAHAARTAADHHYFSTRLDADYRRRWDLPAPPAPPDEGGTGSGAGASGGGGAGASAGAGTGVGAGAAPPSGGAGGDSTGGRARPDGGGAATTGGAGAGDSGGAGAGDSGGAGAGDSGGAGAGDSGGAGGTGGTGGPAVVVRGCDPASDGGAPRIPLVSVAPDGRVARRGVRMTRLGLRALDGVGASTAENLRAAGYDSRRAVGRASRSDLEEVDGIGAKRSVAISRHARALREGRVVRTSERPVPGAGGEPAPVHVAAVADGPGGATVWLVAARDPARDRTRVFRAPAPGDQAGVLEGFLAWLNTRDADRPLLAWRGAREFGHLAAAIGAVAPDAAGTWDARRKVGLRDWAVERDNARLPGRGNDLRDAATAVGFEPARPDLPRRRLRALYRRWAGGGPEPDWAAVRAAARDEVGALAALHRAAAAERPLVGVGRP